MRFEQPLTNMFTLRQFSGRVGLLPVLGRLDPFIIGSDNLLSLCLMDVEVPVRLEGYLRSLLGTDGFGLGNCKGSVRLIDFNELVCCERPAGFEGGVWLYLRNRGFG